MEPRVVSVDEHAVEMPPATHMLVVRNDDRPGMIGTVGKQLGDSGISISSMAVGPNSDKVTALMVLSTDQAVPQDVVEKLAASEGILELHSINL